MDSPGGLIRLGVAAMDQKARSKPMRQILSRLIATGKFDVTVFGDKVIMDENIEDWPICDFLVSFFSTGFPLDKAIAYVELRNPICINDLPLQKVFWDRRCVLDILDAINVPTPERLEVSIDGGPDIDIKVADAVKKELGVRIDRERSVMEAYLKNQDTLVVGGKTMEKPYVEKPVSGEDHNIFVYYHSEDGGGGRRLFRKTGNKSSELDMSLLEPRKNGSFIYEKFMKVENAEDIKVYTLGPAFVHAESRKSPVVDGVVRRNTEGKEMRYITKLTTEERQNASNIAKAFKQNICGFDVLRVNGSSYIIDVNGWSFVKGNEFYYDKCAEIVAKFCQAQINTIPKSPSSSGTSTPREKRWRLKSSIAVFRHADRTPKMKMKFNFKGSQPSSKPFFDLLQGRKDEIILRKEDQLHYVYNAAYFSSMYEDADQTKLKQLREILHKKIGYSGTKAQIKPNVNDDGECDKVTVIVKWGGEFTHAARYQSRDLAENTRKDLSIMNNSILDNIKIYSSSERRVEATAEIFSSALFGAKKDHKYPSHQLIIRKDLLDDSNAAKEPMEQVKRRLKTLLRAEQSQRPEFCWPVPDAEPAQVVLETMELMKYHRKVLRENWENLDVNNIQPRWCCSEIPFLFRERWEKLFEDFCDVEPEKFDPSRVSELYDSLKFDALHNRTFISTIFRAPGDTETGAPVKLKELYRRAKDLFDFIAPQEYGIEKSEKEEIGILTSLPLLRKIIDDLKLETMTSQASAFFYFTKESHIQTLVNLVIFSKLPIVMPRVPELDYMANITFELFERSMEGEKEFSLRISLSEGAHSAPLDAILDAKHALQVQPRRILTNHIALPEALQTLSRYEQKLYKKSTTPFEGMVPVEGDAVYLGKPDPSEQVKHFVPATRPGSSASNLSTVDDNHSNHLDDDEGQEEDDEDVESDDS